MGVMKTAVADGLLTFMWVFTMPLLGLAIGTIFKSLGIDGEATSLVGLIVPIALVATLLYGFSVVGNALGGASFNPSTAISFHAAGLTKPAGSSFVQMAVRLPAQAAGAVLGAKGILTAMPTDYQHRLSGPVLRVDLLTGAVIEGLLTFVLCLYLLVVMMKGPKLLMAKVWLVAATTMGLVMIGSGLTGPSMNPANAFGWAYVKNWHNTWELYYVYWVGPLVGSVSAGWLFGFLFGQPVKLKSA